MNKKIRLLWCGESSHIPSGFGNYSREILTYLYNSNKYDIAELSCYRSSTVPKTEPWRIYPVAVNKDHPLYDQYISNPINQFGQWRFDIALVDFKPDIVIDIRDFWNFSYQEISPLRPFFTWIIGPTYDSSPPKMDTLNVFKNADLVLFHTDWAKNDLEKFNYNKDIKIGDVINDSVNPNIFKPIQYSKQIHKEKFGINSSNFVIGTVMRNQKRKLIPDLMESFAKLKKQYSNIKLYLHTSYPEKEGWNLPSLLLEYNISNDVYLTYRCRHCQNYWPSLFIGQNAICPKCNNTAGICGIYNPISETELVDIYNLFDVYVQYAICEGFGIPQVEAAACGLPVITVDYGAMGDVGKKIGATLVDIIHEFRELETEAMRAYANNNMLIDSLKKFIDMPIKNLNDYGQKTRQLLLSNFSWEKTAIKLMSIIDNIDISKNMSWNCSARVVNHEIKIPKIDNNRDFIYYLVENIIGDNFLKKTNLIQNIIKDLDSHLIFRNGSPMIYTREIAVKELERYINNKIGLEKIRTQQARIADNLQYFINY